MGQEPRKLVDANKRILISVKNAFKCKNYYIIVFFCQKAVEKSLEALIPHEKREFYFSHFLIYFRKIVDISDTFYSFLRELTPQYTTSRSIKVIS